MKRKTLKSIRAFTLIEMMIAMAVMAIGISAFLSFSKNQLGSNNFLQFQLKRSALQANLIGQFLKDSNNCKCLFNGATPFPSAGTAQLSGVTPTTLGIYSPPGTCTSIPSPWLTPAGVDGLKTGSISLINLVNSAPNTYQAVLDVKVQSTTPVAGPSTLDISIPVEVSTVPAGGGNVKFVDCAQSSAKACPAGFTAIGAPGASLFCIDPSHRPASTYYSAVQTCFALPADPNLGSAHVCNLQEWTVACVNNGALQASMLGHGGEVVAAPYADNYSPGRRAIGMAGVSGAAPAACLNFTGTNDGYTDVKPYRCCYGAF